MAALLGESYGTTRSAGVAAALWNDGIILISVALDIEAIFEWPGDDRPYPFFLPTFAATAWYHDKLPQRPASLEPFLTKHSPRGTPRSGRDRRCRPRR